MRDFLINFFNLLTNILLVLIFVRVIFSWMPTKMPKFQKFIFDTTEPILKPIRKIVPPVGGIMDLSPVIAYLLVYLLQFAISKF